MKLGLITDIHEHVVTLRRALEPLAELGVDQIVMIGDVVELGRRLEAICGMLAEAKVVGAWGNPKLAAGASIAAANESYAKSA